MYSITIHLDFVNQLRLQFIDLNSPYFHLFLCYCLYDDLEFVAVVVVMVCWNVDTTLCVYVKEWHAHCESIKSRLQHRALYSLLSVFNLDAIMCNLSENHAICCPIMEKYQTKPKRDTDLFSVCWKEMDAKWTACYGRDFDVSTFNACSSFWFN